MAGWSAVRGLWLAGVMGWRPLLAPTARRLQDTRLEIDVVTTVDYIQRFVSRSAVTAAVS